MFFSLLSKKSLAIWIAMLGITAGSFSYSLGVTIAANMPKGADNRIHLSLAHWDNGGSTETDLVKEVCRNTIPFIICS